MRRKCSPLSRLLASLAIVCEAASFLLVREYASRLEAMGPEAPVPVAVTTGDLARGVLLGAGEVRVEQIPSAYTPPGELRQVGDAVGRTTVAPIAPSEPLTVTRLGRGAGPIASQVPAGLRAVVMPTNLPKGFVRAGERVDVLAIYSGEQPCTETAASGLEALDVLDPSGSSVGEAPSGITPVLLTDPSGTEELAHALAFAEIRIAAVGGEDVASQTEAGPDG